MSEEFFDVNGIDAETGDYDLRVTTQGLSRLAQKLPLDNDDINLARKKVFLTNEAQFALAFGDPSNLRDAGWGLIFSSSISARERDALLDALKPLLEHRKPQAGEYYKEFINDKGYNKGESALKFLARQGYGPGAAKPEYVPYYLLLVGDPEQIPYRFQYQMDVQYAVGRLHFDRIEDYAQYAENVVNAENAHAAQKFGLPRKAVFWGVRTPGDKATELSAASLITPLADAEFPKVPRDFAGNPIAAGWKTEALVGEQATKQNLSRLLSGGTETPALLFTASHGMAFKMTNDLQMRHQGALLCQDWPGPRSGAVKPDWYFSGEDVRSDANLLGSLAFFFACYGAGTPQKEDYGDLISRGAIAKQSFVAALPCALLKRGLLAAVGHVERAWGYSFTWQGNKTLGTFQSTLSQLLYDGYPIGAAMEAFNVRYAEVASHLTDELQSVEGGRNVDDVLLSGLWTTQNDARGYVVLGDPAVRVLAAKDQNEVADRPPYVLTSHKAPADLAPAPAVSSTVEVTPTVTTSTTVVAATTTTTTTTAAPPESSGATNFGLSDIFGGGDKNKTPETAAAEANTDWAQSLKTFGEKLSAFLVKAIDEAVTLEIQTYTGEGVTLDDLRKDNPANATLAAATRIELNGNIRLLLPTTDDGRPDQDILALHLKMVEQAQASRAKLIESAITALSSLTKLGK